MSEEKFRLIAESFAGQNPYINSVGGVGVSELLGAGIIEMPVPGQNEEDSETGEEAADKPRRELRRMVSEFRTQFAGYNIENNFEAPINVEFFEQYVLLELPSSILFDPGKSGLKPESYEIMDVVGEILAEYDENDIVIMGHTDNIPISTPQFPNNWYLSAARAIEVAQYLIEEHGMAQSKIITQGFGEFRPKDTNLTPEGRANNRRVEIRVNK